MNKKILLVYFSGTGGTERIACAFEQELIQRDCTVIKVNLDRSEGHQQIQSSKYEGRITEDFDFLLLIYPVYAFDIPQILHEWMRQVSADHMKAAVISVSGSGEVWPNTGCRNNCCKILEKQGFSVFYEKMMVMPANCIARTKDQLSMWLIKSIPEKVGKILDSLLEGKVRRTHFNIGPFKRYIAKSARSNFNKFATGIKITDQCNGCELCSRDCPVGNIRMTENKPVFGSNCLMCLRCIYACPQSAIKTNVPIVFKNGFSIRKIENEQEGKELEPVEKLAKGWVWIGVRKYLLDEDDY